MQKYLTFNNKQFDNLFPFFANTTGVQILAGNNIAALATALASDAEFIRAEGFVYSHIADEGFHDACAGELLRYRKYLNAENIAIFTDIKKKHSSHAITDDVCIRETADAARMFLTDGVIITGSKTGSSPKFEEIADVKKIENLPVIIGSGVTPENLRHYSRLDVDAVIVGSYFKKDGYWKETIDERRVERFMNEFIRL